MSLSTVYDAYLKGAAICTDTRKIQPGCIFFALKGPSFDGNTFALKAIENGAALAVVDDPAVMHEKALHTTDVLTFLQDLVRHHLRSGRSDEAFQLLLEDQGFTVNPQTDQKPPPPC